jgi:hypothetical protein
MAEKTQAAAAPGAKRRASLTCPVQMECLTAFGDRVKLKPRITLRPVVQLKERTLSQ